jgi:hypothetical protein
VQVIFYKQSLFTKICNYSASKNVLSAAYRRLKPAKRHEVDFAVKKNTHFFSLYIRLKRAISCLFWKQKKRGVWQSKKN